VYDTPKLTIYNVYDY
jgi:hypothetical protein